MTQLIVSLDDASMLGSIKDAIRLLRGVASVKEYDDNFIPNETTIKAMKEAESGCTIVCEDMVEYLKLVNNDLQD